MQPEQNDRAIIFQDDFKQAPEAARYFEIDSAKGSFAWTSGDGLDANGGAMRCQFEKGQVSAGSLKVLFGKSPFNRGVKKTEEFREIYWRVYVKHEAGWEGNPAKLARATCLASSDWTQGFIAHVWSGKGDALCIDPATGIRDNQKVSTRYNDFQNLRWLGSRETQTPVFSAAESGRWVCVESRIRLNTPGKEDGVFQLWIDAKLEASRTNLNWHGEWNDYAINAIFLENYWNEGSTKRQARWFDNFVVSTQPVGPILAATPPIVTRAATAGDKPWEIEVATDPDGHDIIWRSKPAPASAPDLTIDKSHGTFLGSRAGMESLTPGATHWLRIRFTNDEKWSPWHAPFKTTAQ